LRRVDSPPPRLNTSSKKKNDKDKGFNFFRLKSQENEERRGQPKVSTLTAEERRAFENIRRTFGADIEALARHGPLVSTHHAGKAAVPSPSTLDIPAANLYDTNIERTLSLFAPAPKTPTASEDIDNDSDRTAESEPLGPQAPHLIRAAALKALTTISRNIKHTLAASSSSSPSKRLSLSHEHTLWNLLNHDIPPIDRMRSLAQRDL